MRLLYIHSSAVPPPPDPAVDRFALMPESLEGDILQPIWFERPEEVDREMGPGSYPVFTRGRFRYHWFLVKRHGRYRPKPEWIGFYIRKGLELHRQRPFDCVMTYGHTATGMCGAALKLLTGAKLVVEIVAQPEKMYLAERERHRPIDYAKRAYADICLHISLWMADRAHLLFANQLSPYPLLRKTPSSVFHEFVPLASVSRGTGGGAPYVLHVGVPLVSQRHRCIVKGLPRAGRGFSGRLAKTARTPPSEGAP